MANGINDPSKRGISGLKGLNTTEGINRYLDELGYSRSTDS